MAKKKSKPMYYCEKCKEWVPDENKHNRKRHNQGGFKLK